MGSKRKGDATLVLNEFGECLGFGQIVEDIGMHRRASCGQKRVGCWRFSAERNEGKVLTFFEESYFEGLI